MAWKCPCCPQGMLQDPGTNAGRYARRCHRLEEHPDQPAKLFWLPKSRANLGNSGAAAKIRGRLRNLLRSKVGGHRMEFYTVPWGPRKGSTHVFCLVCGNEGTSSTKWPDCARVDRPPRPRHQRLAQAYKWLQPSSDTAAPEELHAEVRDYIGLLQRLGDRARTRQDQARPLGTGRGAAQHGPLHAFKYPMGRTKGYTYRVCTLCGYLGQTTKQFLGVPCTPYRRATDLKRRRALRQRRLLRSIIPPPGLDPAPCTPDKVMRKPLTTPIWSKEVLHVCQRVRLQDASTMTEQSTQPEPTDPDVIRELARGCSALPAVAQPVLPPGRCVRCHVNLGMFAAC